MTAEHVQTTATDGPNYATHDGVLTLHNPATGQHRTFRIRTERWGDDDRANRVLALRTGPETSDYQSFAFVNEGGHIAIWRKHRGTDFERLARTIQDAARLEELGLLEVLFAAHCRRCGRELTTPESIRAGIGPYCAEREEAGE